MSSWSGTGGCGQQVGEQYWQVVAAVEAELELGKVASDISPADRLVGSGDGGLQVAEHGVHPFQRWVSGQNGGQSNDRHCEAVLELHYRLRCKGFVSACFLVPAVTDLTDRPTHFNSRASRPSYELRDEITHNEKKGWSSQSCWKTRCGTDACGNQRAADVTNLGRNDAAMPSLGSFPGLGRIWGAAARRFSRHRILHAFHHLREGG